LKVVVAVRGAVESLPPLADGGWLLLEEARMSKRLLAVITLTAGAAALSGCVVLPAHPGYGYGDGYGYGYGPGYVHVVPPPVIVAPWPYYRGYRGHRGGYPPRRW
jgi:hypothetical protein